jgi:hypothetical protein
MNDFKTAFNYDSIKVEHQEAVEEVIKILQNRSSIPVNFIIEELKVKFKLENLPELKVEDTLWHRIFGEHLKAHYQGYTDKVNENGEKIRVPHLAFSADVDYLDILIKKVLTHVDKK